jgi:hypothetical protein
MRTQSERICERTKDAYATADATGHATADASPKSKVQKSRTRGRTTDQVDSPSPNPTGREVWQILLGGLHSLSLNDYGRPWPYPRRDVLARLFAEHDDDLCLKAAREAREIVVSQDRAPNITGLYAKKLADLAEVRNTVRGSLDVEFVSAGEGR